jgi:hypothetical protein
VVGHALEDVVGTLFDELEVSIAVEEVLAVVRQRVDVDETLGSLDTPLLEQDGVDQREDGRVRPDSEAE